MIRLNEINPVGIGTYKLDLENKDKTLQSLLYSVDKGQNSKCNKFFMYV